MAYNPKFLNRVQGSAAKFTRWVYLTTDALSPTILGTNYFSDAGKRGIKVGDTIEVIIFSSFTSPDVFSGFVSYNLVSASSVSASGGTVLPSTATSSGTISVAMSPTTATISIS